MLGIVMRTEKQNTGAVVRSADHSVRRRDRTEIPTQLRASMKQCAESVFDAASAHYNLGMPSRFGALSYTQEKQENVGQGHQANESSVVKKVAIIQRIRNNVVQRCGSGTGGSGPKPGDPNFIGPLEEMDAARAANWKKPDGSTWWPPNQGAVPGTEQTVTLPKGTILGRIGSMHGSFVAPPNTSPELLSLSPATNLSEYFEIELTADIPNVQQAEVAPWFDMPGGGIQYKLPASIQELMDRGYIKIKKN